MIRDAGNELVVNAEVGMRISILQGSADGVAVYVETQHPVANANGLISIEIGTGDPNDHFTHINWEDGPYFIKTETDPGGGTNYTITGVSQILSVPYALHAKTSEILLGEVEEADPVFAESPAAGIEEDIVHWDAAFSWGDHSLEEYLKKETDPLFTNWYRSEES